MATSDDRPEGLFGRSSGEERTRFGVLLVFIITAFAVQGIATPGKWEELFVAVLLAATLLLSMWVAEARPLVMRVTATVSGVLVTLSLIETLVGSGRGLVTVLANMMLVILAPPTIVLAVVRNLRKRQRVTVEALLGVLCVYLLLGMFFAFVYGAIGHIDGVFFAQQNVQTTTARTLYFSFTTMTTVGYGDLTAASNLGHTLAVSEALLGQVYLVTVVSVIVANLGRSRTRGGPRESADDVG
jgi:Ion channel